MHTIVQADLNQTAQRKDLIHLLSQYALDPMGGGKAISDYCKNNLADALLARSDCHVLLAYQKNKAVGLLTAFEGFSTFNCKPLINIHDIAVLQEHRSQGIATALMRKLQDIALEKQCCKITLEVLEGNEPAKSAYQKFGFSPYELNPKMGKALFWEKLLQDDTCCAITTQRTNL